MSPFSGLVTDVLLKMHSSINLCILNQVLAQTEYGTKVCVVCVPFPVPLCAVIQRHGGNVASALLSSGRSFCLCFFSACLPVVSQTN